MTDQFILKPGEHQMDPDSNTYYNNQTLDDASAIFFIKRDIAILNHFDSYPTDAGGRVILEFKTTPPAKEPKTAIPAPEVPSTPPVEEKIPVAPASAVIDKG